MTEARNSRAEETKEGELKTILVAVAAGALVCGTWGTAAMAKTNAKHKIHYAHAKKMAPVQQVAQMPGNNPMLNPKPYTAIKGPPPEAIKGNNQMGVAVAKK